MLILTRRPGERLRIGENVRLTVLGVTSDKVRLGIGAPRDVPVHRHEVYERIRPSPEPLPHRRPAARSRANLGGHIGTTRQRGAGIREAAA